MRYEDNKGRTMKRRKRQSDKRQKFELIKIAVCIFFSLIIIAQAYNYVQLYQEQKKLEVQLEELRQKNEALELEKEQLQKPEAIENVAREELGLVKAGEVPYVK